jgi:hypothetical protein
MATSRAFALNATGEPLVPGETITGTTQYGLIAVQNLNYNVDFVGSGLKWYNGPDEDANPAFNFANEGYVIAVQGSTSSPDGTTAPFKFYRSADKTEASYINLAEAITGNKYATGNDAAEGLDLLGIASTWNSNQSVIVTYTMFMARMGACSQDTAFYYGSNGRYYTNQSGDLYTGYLYTAPTALGDNTWSWTVSYLDNGVILNSAQEQSGCGSNGEQFLLPQP